MVSNYTVESRSKIHVVACTRTALPIVFVCLFESFQFLDPNVYYCIDKSPKESRINNQMSEIFVNEATARQNIYNAIFDLYVTCDGLRVLWLTLQC